MMNTLWKSYVTIILLMNTAQAYTPERGHIHATFGSYFYKTDSPEGHFLGFQAGSPSLTILGDLSSKGSLEISLGFLNKRYIVEQGDLSIIAETPVVLAGFGYRHWINKRASFSGLLYSSYPTRGAHVRSNTFPERKTTTADKNTENGIELRAQYEVLGNNVWGITVEGRYAYALTRESNEYLDQYGVFIGLRHLIQESKTPRPLRGQ